MSNEQNRIIIIQQNHAAPTSHWVMIVNSLLIGLLCSLLIIFQTKMIIFYFPNLSPAYLITGVYLLATCIMLLLSEFNLYSYID